MKSLLFACLLLLVAASCSTRYLIGTGYDVVILNGPAVHKKQMESVHQTDAFIHDITSLNLITDSLLGPKVPCYKFYNYQFDVYVEKKGIYQRKQGGRKVWKRLKTP